MPTTIINILVMAFIAICIFFLAQWLVPLIFGLVGFNIPPHIVNIIALLIAAGSAWGYRSWGWKRTP